MHITSNNNQTTLIILNNKPDVILTETEALKNILMLYVGSIEGSITEKSIEHRREIRFALQLLEQINIAEKGKSK